jgi:molybdate transport system regulatory protein
MRPAKAIVATVVWMSATARRLVSRPDARHARGMARIFLRVDLEPSGRIGPGKITLLEEIDRTGSISAAGRSLGMSYRRAWILVDELNRLFGSPVVTTQLGGSHGGGAVLTTLGCDLIARFRALEQATAPLVREHLGPLEDLVQSTQT